MTTDRSHAVLGATPANSTHFAVRRKTAAGKWQWCPWAMADDVETTEFPIAELCLDTIRERWGAGTYRVMFLRYDPSGSRHANGNGKIFTLTGPATHDDHDDGHTLPPRTSQPHASPWGAHPHALAPLSHPHLTPWAAHPAMAPPAYGHAPHHYAPHAEHPREPAHRAPDASHERAIERECRYTATELRGEFRHELASMRLQMQAEIRRVDTLVREVIGAIVAEDRDGDITETLTAIAAGASSFLTSNVATAASSGTTAEAAKAAGKP